MCIGLCFELFRYSGLCFELFMCIDQYFELFMYIGLYFELFVYIGLCCELFMCIGLYLELLMCIGLYFEVFIYTGLYVAQAFDLGSQSRIMVGTLVAKCEYWVLVDTLLNCMSYHLPEIECDTAPIWLGSEISNLIPNGVFVCILTNVVPSTNNRFRIRIHNKRGRWNVFSAQSVLDGVKQ